MEIIKEIDHPLLGTLSFCLFEGVSDYYLAEQISDLLVSCATMLSEGNGGHVPDRIVTDRILKYYTTVESILKLRKEIASRFVLVRKQHLLATALVGNSSGVLMPEDTHGSHEIVSTLNQSRALSREFYSIFNIAVDRNNRRLGLARTLINCIFDQYRLKSSGEGLYIRSEPPEHDIWVNLGFNHVCELDDFFEGAILPSNKFESYISYNQQFTCQCRKTIIWEQNFTKKKLKYFGFVKKFVNE